MKSLLVTAALLLLGIAQPSWAGATMSTHDPKDMKEDMKQAPAPTPSDAGFYIALEGGANFYTGYGDKRQTVTSDGATISGNARLHSDWGGVGGIKAGYNFESFVLGNMWGLRLQPAVEAEALYIGENSHGDNVIVTPVHESFSSNSGDFFVNGIFRIKNSSVVTPYIGAGVGLQYITTHGTLTVPTGLIPSGQFVTGLNTSDLDFAGQALVGLDAQVGARISLFSEYKFIDAIGNDGKANFPFAPNGVYRFKPDQIQQNLVTAGVKYNF
jgi:opacity protein-like surface antigen